MTESDGDLVAGFTDGTDQIFINEHSPSLGVNNLNIARSTLTFFDPEEDEIVPNVPLSWTVTTLQGAGHFHQFGDLTLSSDNWFVGCTVSAQVLHRDFDTLQGEELELTMKAAGPWASTMLYDFAAIVARTLIAGNFACQIEVPELTPAADFRHYLRDDEPDLDYHEA